MKRSTERILTTHVGSLPRPENLLELLYAKADGKEVDEAAFAAVLKQSIADIVKKQVSLGIDIVNDGEVGKASFITYASERLQGMERRPGERPSPFAVSRETHSFPEYYREGRAAQASAARRRHRMVCAGPLAYKGQKLLQNELEFLKAAIAGQSVVEAFVSAIAPSNVETTNPNEHYPTTEAYLYAVADAMREEYQKIAASGFLLQIDDPFLVTYYITRPDLSLAECRKWCELRIEALNHSLAGIPQEKIRFHTCYSINMGPRIHDLQLKDVVDLILRVRAGAYSFEAANPRHEHEFEVWKAAKLPDDKILIPGMITQSTVLVEHPELVAQRLLRFVNVVGHERVIAGADCGFASFAGSNEIHPSIIWAKLEALTEGARLASQKLWGRRN